MTDSPTPTPRTLLFVGGGTGGHLYPGIAVAQALQKIAPHLRVLFLCTTREIDRIILAPTGFEFVTQPIERPVRSITGLLRFWKSWRDTKDLARRIIRERRPAAVLGLGGYAAGATTRYAAHKKIPTALLNPDVIPGKANLFLMKHAQAVCCGFEQTRDHVSSSYRSKLITTGCPIRPDLLSAPSRESAMKSLGLDPLLKTLTVTGASLGAQTINEAVPATLAQLKKFQGWQVLHLAGKNNADAVRESYRAIDLPARVIDFTPAMAEVWAASDLCISRSGASTCAELLQFGIPAILMPYPFHRDQHQRINAKALCDGGAALLVDDQRDAKKNAQKLGPVLESLLYGGDKREKMAAAAKAMAKPAAADAVAKVLIRLVEKT